MILVRGKRVVLCVEAEERGDTIAIRRASDDEEMGFVAYRAGLSEDGWLTIKDIELREEHRGWGYGSEAVRLLEEFALERGLAERFRADVDVRNGLGLYFWLRAGYRPLAGSVREHGRSVARMVRDGAVGALCVRDILPPMKTRVCTAALALSAAVAILVTAGCDDEEEPSPSATATATERATERPTPGPTATPTVTSTPVFEGGRDPVTATPSPAGLVAALLTDVRIARQDGFDRITLEFDDGIPGYAIRYVEAPIADPSGLVVEIAGDAFLEIRLEPAAGHDPNTGQETYSGPLELKLGLPAIVEAERTGDFEGVLTWVAGVSEEADFRVLTLADPPRLVVDVEHP